MNAKRRMSTGAEHLVRPLRVHLARPLRAPLPRSSRRCTPSGSGGGWPGGGRLAGRACVSCVCCLGLCACFLDRASCLCAHGAWQTLPWRRSPRHHIFDSIIALWPGLAIFFAIFALEVAAGITGFRSPESAARAFWNWARLAGATGRRALCVRRYCLAQNMHD